MFQLTQNFVEDIISYVQDVFGDSLPFVVLIIGCLIAIYIVEEIVYPWYDKGNVKINTNYEDDEED